MINSKQRAFLRKTANTLDALIQIGKGGVTEKLTKQVDEALEARELIKLRVLESSEYTAREAAAEIGEKTNSEIVQVIGGCFVLYRMNKNPDKRKVSLNV